MRKSISLLVLFLLLLIAGCAAQKPEITKTGDLPESPALNTQQHFPVFSLPVPEREQDRNYLGLSGAGTFQIGQIKAPVVIIEVFSYYCPYCQKVAPLVNAVIQEIQSRPDLKEKIKFIGIGMSNSSYEVNSFRDKYQVPFPLFADRDMGVSGMLHVRGTPTFIGVKLGDKGTPEQFSFKEGAFEDAPQFLAEIIKSAGLEGR